MKGLTVWCEVVCNICNTTDEGSRYSDSSTISRLRKRAKDAGWKFVDGKTLCPECVERRLKK